MSDTTRDPPIGAPDPAFGRARRRHGEGVPRVTLGRGWWLLPMLVVGIALWGLLIRVLFF